VADAVLGIDAAWTVGEPSGVALLRRDGRAWRALAVAPSYAAFLELAGGSPVDWRVRPRGSAPDVHELVDAAEGLGGTSIRLVAVDMPLARAPIRSRRVADTAISRAFGALGCGAHSPTESRPGALGTAMMGALRSRGFPLATSLAEVDAGPRSIEVYPHPALLRLMRVDYRVPYKVGRSTRYWKGASVARRIEALTAQMRGIHAALSEVLGVLPFDVPAASEVGTLAGLKRYEDALDAVVCAWVASRVLAREASPFGDASACIWVPT
jgi:predicted RNase H-like nuclease